MAMDRDALVAAVRLNILRSSEGFSDANIITRLDWAQEDLALTRTWNEMLKTYTFNLTASEPNYTYPTRTKEVFSLMIENDGTGTKLTQHFTRSFDAAYPEPSISGESEPSMYFTFGSNHFSVHPIPDTAYDATIRVSVFPAALATAASEPDLLRKDRLIIARATEFCFQAMGEDNLAAYWHAVGQGAFAAALQADGKVGDWTPVAEPFLAEKAPSGETWKQPFVFKNV